MLSHSVERLLPYEPAHLFDLVADVERYPEFLRWWVSARVSKHGAEVYYTDQLLGFGPVRFSFRSKTVLHRPERIDVTSNQSPFRQFHLHWVFQPVAERRCVVQLTTAIEFNSALVQRLVDRALPLAAAEIVSAFEDRADRLYADRSGGVDCRAGASGRRDS
jgi:coenzyme Q-binding protein COQ10